LLPEEKPAAPAPRRPTSATSAIAEPPSPTSAITESKSATAAHAPAAAPATDWNFDESAAPRRPRPKKGGVPVWSWAVAGAAVLLVAIVGVIFATRGGDAPKNPVVEKPPQTPPGKKSDKPPPEVAEAGPGVFYLAACRPELLATSSKLNKNWILWDAWPPENPREFTGHKAAVTCIAIDREGTRAVTGSADRTLRTWDLKTKKEVGRLDGHRAPVVAVALSPDGKRALSADLGPYVRLWDLDNGKEIRSFEHPDPIAAVAFSPDGETVVCALGKGNSDTGDALWLWETNTGKERFRVRGPRTPVT